MVIDEWVEAALIDGTLIANALIGLKNPPAPALQWGRRKSRYILVPVIAKKDKEPTRLSPTTPLSWRGDATVSGSDHSSAARSKGIFANESLKSAAKKGSAKKRSFVELEVEEKLLLNKRLHPEKDLASARTKVKEQRAVGKKLKTGKFNLHLKSTNKICQTSTQPQPQPQSLAGLPNTMDFRPIDDSALPKQKTCRYLATKSVFNDAPKDIGSRGFVLPDLNLELLEDGIIPDAMYGIR